MRYHYEKPKIYMTMYGETYECDHPVYDKCALFKIGRNGLAVIQQRYEFISYCNFTTNHVGYENETYKTRKMGDVFR